MAFPGTYNFNYYRGDTFSFIIRPKDANGSEFPLSGFSAAMVVADRRGPNPPEKYNAEAVINEVNNTITCTIGPTAGRNLTTLKTWVYDVQIDDGSSIFTLLNGNIIVTDDVTGAI